jgi:hypothetical protein
MAYQVPETGSLVLDAVKTVFVSIRQYMNGLALFSEDENDRGGTKAMTMSPTLSSGSGSIGLPPVWNENAVASSSLQWDMC